LETLRYTIDAIPPSLIKETEELRDAWPELFETTLVHGVQVSASDFFQPAPQDSSRCGTELCSGTAVYVITLTKERDIAPKLTAQS